MVKLNYYCYCCYCWTTSLVIFRFSNTTQYCCNIYLQHIYLCIAGIVLMVGEVDTNEMVSAWNLVNKRRWRESELFSHTGLILNPGHLIRKIKHRRFWVTDVGWKFMILLLARFIAQLMSYKTLILAFNLAFCTWHFRRIGSNARRRGEVTTSGWRAWLKNVCA